MIPNPLIVRAYTLRALRLWFGTRALVSLLILLAQGHPLRISPSSTVVVVLLSVGVCFVDTWRRRERALLGNLAVSPIGLTVLFVLPPIVGEALLFAARDHLP